MRFAPFVLSYLELSEQWNEVGLSMERNRWNQVLDFNSHRKQHSPHWSEIPLQRLTSVEPVLDDEQF